MIVVCLFGLVVKSSFVIEKKIHFFCSLKFKNFSFEKKINFNEMRYGTRNEKKKNQMSVCVCVYGQSPMMTMTLMMMMDNLLIIHSLIQID